MNKPLGSRQLRAAAADIRTHDQRAPEVALVLGSGLGDFADAFSDKQVIPYARISHMPASAVIGHAGNFVLGECGGRKVMAMQGRVHLYEGHSPDAVVFGLRLMITLGARTVILTNAAGGIRSDWSPGELMLITDHLNLTGQSPLTGPNDAELGTRFPDMSEAYDRALIGLAQRCASELGAPCKEGVYAGLLGPSYETPAEIRMLRTLGADAVGMSTVLETIAARHMGARCLGISCITNAAAGISTQPLNHDEVQLTAHKTRARFAALLERIVKELS